uniref:Kinesin motor domain-containing protein n=1 Tax=Ciona savignyi TaxID=51511 RepID=H2YVI0_CIOSA
NLPTPIANQREIFDELQPILTSFLDGYNACIVAYGQTGSGKTQTMLGNPQDPGIEFVSRKTGSPNPPPPAGMSGVTGPALRESSFINRSLSSLADVLASISERRSHIPYRNSKLTHLLQDSIGGDAKMLIILCVSPTRRFITETMQTLQFGSRARQVQRGPPRKRG